MTAITHGKIAPVLADGSSLLQKLVLTEEQSHSIAHDLSVLVKDRSLRFSARILNVGGRALIVALLFGLMGLVLTSSVNLLAAGVVAVALLFSTDALNAVDRKLAERREVKLRELKFAETAFSLTRSQTFNKSFEEKAASYFDLIRTGEAKVGSSSSHRLRLVGVSGGRQELHHVATA